MIIVVVITKIIAIAPTREEEPTSPNGLPSQVVSHTNFQDLQQVARSYQTYLIYCLGSFSSLIVFCSNAVRLYLCTGSIFRTMMKRRRLFFRCSRGGEERRTRGRSGPTAIWLRFVFKDFSGWDRFSIAQLGWGRFHLGWVQLILGWQKSTSVSNDNEQESWGGVGRSDSQFTFQSYDCSSRNRWNTFVSFFCSSSPSSPQV